MQIEELRVEAKVNATEDGDKVKHAIEGMFGSLPFEETSEGEEILLVGRTRHLEALDRFGELLQRERIRDAARKVMLRGLEGNVIEFCLNKQVSYVGHVSFCEPAGESPLGPIRVQIRCNNPMQLIDWFTPRTKRGGKV